MNGKDNQLLSLVTAILLGCLSTPTWANTYLVDTTDDDPSLRACTLFGHGDCSLRGALMNANANAGDDEIWLVFPLIYNLTINGYGGAEEGDLDITGNVLIHGPSASSTRIDASGMSGNHRIFEVASGVTVTIRGLWLTGGDGGPPATIGGAIYNQGILTLDATYVGDNDADQFGGGIFNSSSAWLEMRNGSKVFSNISEKGGGIYNNGTLVVTDSLIGSNRALEGGGIYNTNTVILTRSTFTNNAGRGILNSGSVNATNCLFARNEIFNDIGGAIYNSGTLDLTNVTLYDNTCNTGETDSIFTDSTGITNLLNNLIVGGCGLAPGGTINSLGGNLQSPPNCCLLSDPTDHGTSDPMLGFEGYQGGLVFSSTLLPGSPAIDGATNLLCPGTDQRGRPRPIDGDGAGSPAAVCDCGAYEYDPDEVFIDGFESGDFDWSAHTVVPTRAGSAVP